MSSCIFCQIAAGKAPASLVFEDEHTLAFMSLEQPNPHKVLVIPRRHVESIYDLNDDLPAAIFQTTVRVARAIRAASACEGLNLVQANGRAGQQDVFHFHLHLVPRFTGDNIVLNWDNTPANRKTLNQLANEIRSEITSH